MKFHLALLQLVLTLSLLSSVAFAMPPAGPATESIKGKVTETMDSGGYTYLKIKAEKGEVWAAVPQTTVKVGSDAEIQSPMIMKDFESKTLKRKFDLIFFGTLSGNGPAAPATAGKSASGPKVPALGSPTMSQAHGAPAPKINLKDIQVNKAEGPNGKTVAEVYAGKAALKGKEIAVRGKVTKASFGIMGKNWIHVSDGTGKLEDKNFDLTVSTAGKAQVGDVVVVKGILATDRDIGAGYFYPVMIEDGKVEK